MATSAEHVGQTLADKDLATDTGGPVSKGDRINSLDFIRGIAVMGILAANIVAFGQPFSAYMWPDGFLVPDGDPGGWMWMLQYTFIDGKMRGLFTLLFGAGLYLFMERAWARGSTRHLQMWRLLLLLGFGAIHFYFIWYGDILLLYALIGFLVVPCLKWTAKSQLWTGIIAYLFGALFFAPFMSFPYLVVDTSLGEPGQPLATEVDAMIAAKAATLAEERDESVLIARGDYAGFVEYRLENNLFDPFANVMLFAFETFPMMLIGVALYRFGFFSGGLSQRKMRLWGWVGFVGGALISFALAWFTRAEGLTYYATLAAFVGWSPLPRIAMVLGIAALLVTYSPKWTGWLAERVRAAGRAAFTNYLGTSIVMLFVFHGWALGLYGELNRPQLYLVVAAMWVVMLLWSKPWLDRFRYGPLEWLWRCMTYRTLFALRR